MAHFAEIDKNNIVTRVIVAEQNFIDSGAVGDPANWLQTSYNTYAGLHAFGEKPLRKNFASVGYTYDKDRDAFIPPPPEGQKVELDEEMCVWIPKGSSKMERAIFKQRIETAMATFNK